MVKKVLNKIINRKISVSADAKNIENAYKDENFPFLISFPRTGSHWLRMLMELYFEKPSLVRSFYFHNTNEFTCVHNHDIELTLFRKNILYLYRNPVDTIFSQLNYYKEDTNNKHRIKYWTTIYALHLEKYLLNDDFTSKKVIITYENLINDIDSEFIKICNYFDFPFNHDRLVKVKNSIDKQKLKEKTKHDIQVVNLSNSYSELREEFKLNHTNFIKENMLNINFKLKSFISFKN